jgi:hypothetical protein
MKLIIEAANKNNLYLDKIDGIILPLKDYSVESMIYFDLDEIRDITKKYKGEVFVKINSNLFNKDIPNITNILIELDKMNITGIFFYDLAILELKRELNLKTDLIWNQTHMVNNYKTCDYYYSRGCKYALLGKEITLEEISEIVLKSKITCMVEVVGKPSVAFSRRKLITNYYKDLGEESGSSLIVTEKVTNTKYLLLEDKNGTSFFLDIITNGTGIIKDLYDINTPYIIFRESGIDNFLELLIDTKKYISSGCCDNSYVDKYKRLGDSTNFFFKKTIYKVKKNG